MKKIRSDFPGTRVLPSFRLLGLAVLVFLVMTVSPALARNNVFGVSWNLSVPTGNTSDFLSDFSFRGMGVEYKTFINKNVAYGVNVSWNVMAEEMDEPFQVDSFSVSGLRTHYVNSVPIYVSGCRYFGSQMGTRYFVGGHAGVAWLEQRMDLGLFSREESNWHAAFAPEIGIQLPYSAFLGSFSVRYNYMLKAGETEAQSYLEIRLGFSM